MTPTPGQGTNRFSIGDLASRTGPSVDTIRYYERIGLMPEVWRTAGGHRLYGSKHVTRLVFVRRGRDLGLSLDEIRELIDGIEGKTYGCSQVRALLVERVQRTRSHIEELQQIVRNLETMIETCGGAALPNCPAIEAMLAGEDMMPDGRCCSAAGGRNATESVS